MDTIIKLSEKESMTLKAISSREIVVQVPNFITIKTQKDSKNRVTSLIVDDFVIELGKILYLNRPTSYGKIPFKVNYIEMNKNTGKYSLLCTKLTKTSKYLMPLLYQKNVFESRTSMLWETNFINCYTGTREEGYMKHLYAIYRFSGDTRYTTFEGKLMKHAYFSRKIDLDKYHVMYVFEIPQNELYEYYCFISGNYSKFSEEYKHKIIKFCINPAVTPISTVPSHPLYGVLYKTEKRKNEVEDYVGCRLPEDAELESIPSELDETYFGDIEIHEEAPKSDEF